MSMMIVHWKKHLTDYNSFIMKKLSIILLNALPILLMVGLIPLVKNDYTLTFIYAVIIAIAFAIKREKKDGIIFLSGFILMIIFESIFVSTGVETFVRHSLFGIMPLWLPFLWGYGFVGIKRTVKILEK
jgi:hypothetical protein